MIFNHLKKFEYFQLKYPKCFKKDENIITNEEINETKNLNEEINENKNLNEEKDLIFEKQKKETGWKRLIKAFPCNTSNVLMFNPYFSKSIKEDNNFYLKAYEFYKLKNEKIIGINSDIGNKFRLFIQTRGVGKTFEALSHAVTDNKPTIYIDCSINSSKKDFRDTIFKTVLKTGDDEIVEESFLKIYCIKILFFLIWYETNIKKMNIKKEKIDFSDFLRISMINNNESESYDYGSQLEINEWIETNNLKSSDLINHIYKKLNLFDLEKETVIPIDEAFDMGHLKEKKFNCYKNRTGKDDKSDHNIYHPFISSLQSLKEMLTGINPIELYGTSLCNSGILSGNLSSFKITEVFILFICFLVNIDLFIKYLKQFFLITNEEENKIKECFKIFLD
jgi:hypothetical protein